jgi:acetyl-CoA carboxylase biotin carboxyl carrier protein
MIRKKPAGKAAPGGLGGKRTSGLAGQGSAAISFSSDPAMARVRELAQIATEFDLAEVELEPAGKVRVVRRTTGPAALASLAASAPAVSHAPLAVVTAPLSEASEDGIFVSSPFVGTFYRAASPDAASFVEVGQSVRKGQVICIIEAMKLMNEIESEADGKVAEVLVKNGEHVEYGQKLFRLTKA